MATQIQEYFMKTGDKLVVSLQFWDEASQEPVDLPSGASYTCAIKNRNTGVIFANPVVTPASDQVNNKGVIDIALSNTQNWPVGIAEMDVNVVVSSANRHSQTITFTIERSIAPLATSGVSA